MVPFFLGQLLEVTGTSMAVTCDSADRPVCVADVVILFVG